MALFIEQHSMSNLSYESFDLIENHVKLILCRLGLKPVYEGTRSRLSERGGKEKKEVEQEEVKRGRRETNYKLVRCGRAWEKERVREGLCVWDLPCKKKDIQYVLINLSCNEKVIPMWNFIINYGRWCSNS